MENIVILDFIINYIISPRGIIMLSLLMLVIGRYVFKMRYINCFDIIIEHIKCFRKRNNRISVLALFLYFGIPMLLATSLMMIKPIDDSCINVITIIVSILTSMFFTLLTLTIDMKQKVKLDPNYSASDASIIVTILRETYYSIMFEILVSVCVLIMCFIDIFASRFNRFESLVIYYLIFVLLSNLFMILKRIFKVIDEEMKH